MLLFGHLGIAMGVAYALVHLFGRPYSKVVDYRFILLGSVLSDIIDKPVGLLLGVWGRNLGHTLLFPSILAIGAWVVLASKARAEGAHGPLGDPLLLLAIGVTVHLLLDRMWEFTQVLLWPLLGFAFPPGGFDPLDILGHLLTDPYSLAGEVGGVFLLLVIAHRHGLLSSRPFREFLRTGVLEAPR